MVYIGPGIDADAHAHHAVQVTVRLVGDVAFDFGGGFIERAVTLIAADRRHAQRAAGATIASVYVEPESTPGRALVTMSEPPLAVAPPDDPSSDGAWSWSSRLLDSLAAPNRAPAAVDPRILRLIEHLRENVEQRHEAIDALAKKVALSPGRLTHLFSEQIGIPLRPYILWLRLQRAGDVLAKGLNVTEAAHAAGFADGAHLSRTFRRMFGIPPSVIAASAVFASQ